MNLVDWTSITWVASMVVLIFLFYHRRGLPT